MIHYTFRFLLFFLPLLLTACSLKSCDLSFSGNEKKSIEVPVAISFNTEKLENILLFDALLKFTNNETQETYQSNLVSINDSGEYHNILNTTQRVNIYDVQTSPDNKSLYTYIGEIDHGMNYMRNTGCSVLKINLDDGSSGCFINQLYNSDWKLEKEGWSIIKNKKQPIQFDNANNSYFIARHFLNECRSGCQLGDTPNNYHYINNTQGFGIYLQNKFELYRVDKNGNQEKLSTFGINPIAYSVMDSDKIILLSRDNTTIKLDVLFVNNSVVRLPVESISSLVIDDSNTMIINNHLLAKINNDHSITFLSANNPLRNNANLQVLPNGEIVDVQESIVYRSLPFQVRPVAQLQSNLHSLDFLADKIIESSSTDIIIHDIKNFVSSSIYQHLKINESDVPNSKPAIQNDSMYILMNRSTDTATHLFQIKLSDTSQKKDILLPDADNEVTEIRKVITLNTTDGSNPFYIKSFTHIPENKHSISVEFTQKPQILDNTLAILQENIDLSKLEYLCFQLGNYFHFFPDTDRLENNNFINGAVDSHTLLIPNKRYTLAIDTSLKSSSGEQLKTLINSNMIETEFSFTTALETAVYHGDIASFHRQYLPIPATIADEKLLAKYPCSLPVCDGYYYNLGIQQTNNVRLEFSSDSHFIQLALWNAHKYAQSYSRLFSPEFAFWANTKTASVRYGTDTLVQAFSSFEEKQLGDSSIWRRYRIELYSDNIQISYSLDGINYYILPDLMVSNANPFTNTDNNLFWLMEFDGALDNLTVSNLDSSGNIINFDGDIVLENFNTNVAFSHDADPNNKVGFEENIATFLPLPEGTGSPDQSFGKRGIAPINHNPGSDSKLQSLTMDNAGNVYVAGRMFFQSEVHMALWKLDNNGNLDLAFANDGVFIYSNEISEARTVSWGPDNKIYIAGYIHNGLNKDLAAWRLSPDGNLDTGFALDGVLTFVSEFNEEAYSMLVDNSSIYFGGYTQNTATIWKYNLQGALDVGFNASGILNLGPVSSFGSVNTISFDTNNNLLVAGNLKEVGSLVNAVAYKISSAGNILSYLNLGMSLALTESSDLSTIIESASGKILLFGYSYFNSQPDLLLVQLNTDFSVDTSFASNGLWQYDSNGFDFSYTLLTDTNNLIYLLSSTWDASLELIRLNPDGTIDQNFSQQGSVYRNAYAVDMIFDGVMQKMILAGTSITADNHLDENALWKIDLQ